MTPASADVFAPKSNARKGGRDEKSVLVIDDDLNVCRDLKSALEDEETEVHYTLSTDEALCAFIKWNFCLVIMNSSLPESNGCEVLKIIRQTKAIPIIVLSTKADVSKRTAILQAGANVCLEKPHDLNELLAQARSLISLCTASSLLDSVYTG